MSYNLLDLNPINRYSIFMLSLLYKMSFLDEITLILGIMNH